MSSTFETFQRDDGRWAWHLIADNGRVIATDGGQGYENREYCERIGSAIVRGEYAPDRGEVVPVGTFAEPDLVEIVDLPEPELLPGAMVIQCTECDATVVGANGDTLEHANDGAHVYSPRYGG